MINTLIRCLPIHAEDGHYSSEVQRVDIIESIIGEHPIDKTAAIALIELLESILTSFCLLDEEKLSNGVWCFPSYPANLVALSLLSTFADSKQKILPHDFWQGGQTSDPIKEEQRGALKWLEDHRVSNHLEHQAIPIRTVYVAWVLIKLDGRFLLHKKEDTQKRYEKDAGDYGPVGGKTNINDLQDVVGMELLIHEQLQQLQQLGKDLQSDVVAKTLQREIEEETGLVADEYSEVTIWKTLRPYTQSQGLAPVYAYTTYHIHIYTLKLTTPGYLKLRNRIESDEGLIEVSDVELARQKSDDGQQTFHLDALLQSYPDPSLFEAEIQRIPDSYSNEYTTYSAGRSKINYIFGAGQIQEDTSGNMSKISCDLTTDESGMLLMLAAHAKQLSVVLNTGNSIKLYDNGWMKIDSDSIYEIVEGIGRNLGKVSRGLLEILPRERFVRIKLDPKIIFLDFQYFGIRLEQNSKQHWKLDLIRETIDTPIGCVAQGSISVEPTPSNAMELKKIIAGRGTDDSDLLNKLRKQLQSTYQKEGLVRLLGKEDNKEVVLCRIHDCNSP